MANKRLEDYTDKLASERISAYFKQVEAEGREPTVPGLCSALNVTKRNMQNFLDKAERKLEALASPSRPRGEERYNTDCIFSGQITERIENEAIQGVNNRHLSPAGGCRQLSGESGGEEERDGEDINLEVAERVQKALQRMQDRLEQRKDTMALFLLKQPLYGGYMDRPADAGTGGPVRLDVRLEMPRIDAGREPVVVPALGAGAVELPAAGAPVLGAGPVGHGGGDRALPGTAGPVVEAGGER